MKSYPVYTEYSRNGFPASWEQKRLRFTLRMNPSKNEIDLDDSDMVSFIPMDAVGEYGGIRLNEEKELGEIGSGYTYFCDDDVVVAKITPCFENGKGALVKGLKNKTAFGTTELHVMRADREQLEPEFLFYLTISDLYRKIGESEMYGAGGQKRVPESFIKDFRAGLPSVREQQAIARFLDFKTAQIDALIAKKKALLDKLAEKRTALISHAVTRGLDPSVPMKDSGVAWLEEIPAHWNMTRLKYATCMVMDCPHDTPVYSDDGDYPVVRTADLFQGKLDLSKAYLVEYAEYRHRVRRAVVNVHDILYGREGERWGFAAIVPESPKVCLGQRMMQFRTSDQFHSRFLMWHLNADCVYQQGALDVAGSTAPHVNVETIKNYWLVEPPLHEQVQIADFLNKATDLSDYQVTHVAQVIDRLIEYRSALITSAVTGKIDVRGVEFPASTEAQEPAHA